MMICILRKSVALLALMSVAVGAFGESHEARQYKLVKNVSSLKEGDTLIVANREYGVAMGVARANNHNRYAEKLVFVDDSTVVVDLNEKADEVVLKRSRSKFFRLYTAKDSCLAATGKNYKNYLSSVLESKINGTTADAEITINSNGDATVQFQIKKPDNDGCVLGFNNDNNLFACYRRYVRQLPVQLYKKTSFSHLTFDGNDANASNKAVADGAGTANNNVVLQRSFVADGGWYTLCLPFALTEEEIKDQFRGATFEEFESVGSDGQGTTLGFKKVSSTVAGVPYLVRPTADVVNPVFLNKAIIADEGTSTNIINPSDGAEYSFVGVIDPENLDAAGANVRFLGGKDGTELLAPDGSGAKLKGLRAYFVLPSNNGGGASESAKIAIDGTATSISATELGAQTPKPGVYRLDGTYAGRDAEGLAKGLYIINGKKTILK